MSIVLMEMAWLRMEYPPRVGTPGQVEPGGILHNTHAPRPHARPRWPGAAGFGRPGGLPVVHWGGRKRQNATWKASQKKKPLVLNVLFTLFQDIATGDAVPWLRPQSGR